MQIGTFARTNEQVLSGLKAQPDFIELRMDLSHRINFTEAKTALNQVGVPCTLHLPSDPTWKPVDMVTEIVPFVDLGQMIDAELVVFHGPISSMLYDDIEIDSFLESLPLLYDAATESGITLAIETLVFYYTEMMLIFEQMPKMRMVLDIGHGQILSTRNRAIGHIETYCDRIETVNVHDNHAYEIYQEIVGVEKMSSLSREDLRDLALKSDEHLPIGNGSIEFEPIFAALKQCNYDNRFLMLSANPDAFEEERKKFLDLWLKA
ncbi:sugar phosphate isomerase/epimerase [Candidatus Thorarchaeota archaeon]|nr:MAG: sugar phosphate isomerase/epimerase [Candidatus Thorarchaeota archaeon]